MSPSPDATPYVDLTLFDKDPQDIFADALVNLQTYLPEWEPREGHTEVMLMESMALEVAQLIFAVNRIPGAVLEVMLRLYGVTRDLGTFPTSTVTFTAIDTTGHSLPAGVRVAVPMPGGEDALVFATTAPLEIPAGQLTATADVMGTTATAAANGFPASTVIELLDAVTAVESVELGSAIGGGSGPEEDADWFARGVNRFARLTETLVLPPHFTAAALEDPLVQRAFTVDNYDPGTAGSPGDHAGHVTVAVYGDGAPLTAPQKAVLEARFDEQSLAQLAVHVIDPTITEVDVTAEVVVLPGFASGAVTDAVEAALATYLSPATWGWSATVYRNELISLIDQVPGVSRVVNVTVPAGDQAIAGVAPLATLGAVTVTAAP